MKLPIPAPQVTELIDKLGGEAASRVLFRGIGPEIDGEYEHWDKMRHRPPPEGLSSEAWWLGIKMARSTLARSLPLVDKSGARFRVTLTDSMLRRLHYIDREAAGTIQGDDGANHSRFLLRSLIEEAMTSSQLEGASTTRAVAKEMLATGRQPRDHSERMIYNNHVAMQMIRNRGKRPFTVNEILELHSVLTDQTLDHGSDCGRLRVAEDNVVIYDRGSPPTLLHVPPPASQVRQRLEALCAFANDEGSEQFLHPVVRAIAVHFQIGYDHPFVDGNGRTARALFYWSMMNSGYWLTEYLSISSVLKKHPGKYLRAYLYTESDAQDLSYFVAQQLEAVEESILAFHKYVVKKHEEDRRARALLRSATVDGMTINHRQRALLANGIKDPDRAYTVASHQAAHAITYPTALNDLNGLVGAGLLQKFKVGKAFEYFPVADLAVRLT